MKLRSIVFSAGLVLCNAIWGGESTALAADYSAGDACSSAGAIHTTNDANGADFLICNGSNWLASISYYKDGGLGISSLTGQPAPQYNTDSAVWSIGAGSDIYYNSGTPMVGIGKTDPTVSLDVVGDINFTGTLTDVSDLRMKDNVERLNNSLEGILSLQGYSFTMKDDPAHKVEYGLIAQEVEAVFPELVVTKPDETKTLNYLGMIAPLVEAMKQQQSEIDRLKTRVEELEQDDVDLPEAR